MARIEKDPEKPAQFTAPADDVHERVKAVTYEDRVRQKKAQTESLKGRGKPLGGAEPIPPGKLAPLAMATPDFDDEEPPPINERERLAQQQAQVPPIPGVGSAYEVNQKLTRGEYARPVSVAEAKKEQQGPRKLSPTTVEAMKMMSDTLSQQEEKASPPTPDIPAPPDEDKKDLDKADAELQRKEFKFDFDGMMRVRNRLLSDERKKRVEARLEKLEIDDMIRSREIAQKIPVVPGKLELELRTFSQREYMFCLQFVYEHIGSEAYQNELLNVCKMVCSLVAINGKHLTDHRKKAGERGEEIDRKQFETKMEQLTAFPVQLIADISVQLMWFNERVNELFDLDTLKNG